MALRVVEVFGQATLRDLGRPGFRKFGVPTGGAFDSASHNSANQLLGNEKTAATIELALGTLTLVAESDVTIAAVGAAAALEIADKTVSTNRTVKIKSGDFLRVLPPMHGLRTYMALPGGIKGEPILGSHSGISISKGDIIEPLDSNHVSRPLRSVESPPTLKSKPLSVIPLSHETTWASRQYKASNLLDRVGIRLEGKSGVQSTRSTTSEPSTFGVIQVTEDGQLVILGPDGPTIGGYKKVGCVKSTDLDRLGQIAPGDDVSFVLVTSQT